MTAFGKDLIFLKSIKFDGSGLVDVSREDMKHLDNTNFNINGLSLTNQLWIASGFNTFIVKLKKYK